MKRVLTIRAKDDDCTVNVRIAVKTVPAMLTRQEVSRMLVGIGDKVMVALSQADYLHVPLSRQRVGR